MRIRWLRLMLREAQRMFREGRHPECQWSSGQRGLVWVFASRSWAGKHRTDSDGRWLLWCFLSSCLRTESLETFLIPVSWPQGKFTLLNPPKILEWRIGCGLTDHTQLCTVPLSPHTNEMPQESCSLPRGAFSTTQKLQWGFTSIDFSSPD